MADIKQNARDLGINILYIIFWVSFWGIVETTLEIFTVHERYKFYLYMAMFLIAFFIYLFVDTTMGCPSQDSSVVVS